MSRRDRIAAAAIAATLAISALAIGSATRHTALVAAGLGLGCGAIYVRSRGALRGWPWLLRLLGLGLALTAVQLIPLPVLGAKGALVAANAAALGEDPPALSPISFDPAATWLELAKLIGYLGFAVCAMRVGATQSGRRVIAAAIAGVGGAVAAITALHELAGATALYGLYEPRYAEAPQLFGPFFNPNHLAGFLALTTPVAAAMAIASRGAWRLLWAGCAGLSAAMALLSLSRTGAVSLLIGAVALIALALPILRNQRRHRARPLSSNRIAIGLIIATGAIVAALTIGRGAFEEITRTDVDELTGERGKAAAWGDALDVLWANKWTGVGRGAFEHAAPSSEENLTFSHVENEYLQAAVDWGLAGALLVLLAFVMTARHAAARASGSLVEAGLAAGLLAIAVHQLADFTFELPGAALPALAALAVLARGEIVKNRSKPALRIAAITAGALGIAAAASPLATPARVETDALAEAFIDRDPREALEPALDTWRRHPGDFIAAAQVAEALFARGDRRAVAVINRALARSPAHPGLHRIAARMLLASQRPEQALIEYREAIARATDRVSLIRELVAAFPDRAGAAAGLPLDRRHAGPTLEAIAKLGDHALGFHYTTALVARHPDSGRFHSARVHHALQLGRIDEAVESARIAVERGRPGAALALARALFARGDHAGAEAILTERRGRPMVRNRRQIIAELQLLARARSAQGKHAAAAESLEEAIELRGRDHVESASLYRELAAAQQAAGQRNAAAVSRQRAALLERRIE